MKLEWKKEELIHNMGRFWWACGICRQGSTDRESITHSKSCPFSDDTVKGFHLSVFPTHDTEICGRCGVEWSDCPMMTVCDGWDQVTHERLLVLCNRYAKDREAVRSRLRERKFKGVTLAELCGNDKEKIMKLAAACMACEFGGADLSCCWEPEAGRAPCQSEG